MRISPDRVRPSYHPVLHAHIRLIEDGKPPTCVNIGKELGISKQAVSQMFQRHPDLRVWIGRQVEAAVAHFVSSILHRHAMLGIQGSVPSAELYLTAMGARGFTRDMAPGDDDPSRGDTIINLLVPRPEVPTFPPHEPEQQRLPAPSTIPTVAVRRG